MRKISVFLMACCLLVNTPSVADVDRIQIRLDQNGRISDISTSLTAATMALTNPIQEPDGTSTDPDPSADEELESLAATVQEEAENKNNCSGAKPYPKGNECVECLEDDHCSGNPKNNVCDTKKNECVECLENSHCSGNPENICNTKTNYCVECLSDDDCTSEKKCYIADHACVECLSDDDCTGSKICDSQSHTCEVCDTATHHGCENATGTIEVDRKIRQSYCIDDQGTRKCSECRIDTDDTQYDDCANLTYSNRPYCSQSLGMCVVENKTEEIECPTQRTGNTPCKCPNTHPFWDTSKNKCTRECPELTATGECKCQEDLVWDPHRKKCVNCYDSISENWTDFGCNKMADDSSQWTVKNHKYSVYNYSPRQQAKGDKPVCDESKNEGLGECFQCLQDSHCPKNQECKDNSCGCTNGTPQDNDKCYCNKNYKETGMTACTVSSHPWCNSKTHLCEACPDGTNYDENQKLCVACNGNLGSNMEFACTDNDKPYCNPNNHVCEACPDSQWFYTGHHICTKCDKNSTPNSDDTKCTCKTGYGAVGKTCKYANLPTGTFTRPGITETCDPVTVFSIQTVAGISYKLTAGKVVKFDDSATWGCGSNSETWCNNKNDDGECSAATINLTGSNAKTFSGPTNGSQLTCTLTVTNGQGNCEDWTCRNTDDSTCSLKIEITSATEYKP